MKDIPTLYCERRFAKACKVRTIVDSLDANGDGEMSVSEVKVLISKITETPESEIPDDHPEVLELANISASAMVHV